MYFIHPRLSEENYRGEVAHDAVSGNQSTYADDEEMPRCTHFIITLKGCGCLGSTANQTHNKEFPYIKTVHCV